jgi:hypothetical protein
VGHGAPRSVRARSAGNVGHTVIAPPFCRRRCDASPEGLVRIRGTAASLGLTEVPRRRCDWVACTSGRARRLRTPSAWLTLGPSTRWAPAVTAMTTPWPSQSTDCTRSSSSAAGGSDGRVEEVELATAAWVDRSNQRRLHLACADLRPAELEAAYARPRNVPSVAWYPRSSVSIRRGRLTDLLANGGSPQVVIATWQIRPAGSGDAGHILSVSDEATVWLVDHGLSGQWGEDPPSLPPQ